MDGHSHKRMGRKRNAASRGGTIHNLYMLAREELMDEELRVFVENKVCAPENYWEKGLSEVRESSEYFSQIYDI